MLDGARTGDDLKDLLVPGVTRVGPHAHCTRLALRRWGPVAAEETAQERGREGDAAGATPDLGLFLANFHSLRGGEGSMGRGTKSACRRIGPTECGFKREGLR